MVYCSSYLFFGFLLVSISYTGASIWFIWYQILTLCMQPPSFPTPFSTLIQTIPLLTIFTVLCTCLSYTHTLLLRYFTRPMLIATTLFIPISLILSALSAFSGSFIYDGPLKPTTWGTTIGLRIFSLLPLAFALLASRSLLSSISHVNRTASTVHLATSLLLSNPPLLAISPALLFAALLSTLPFLSLIFRLLLVGYYGNEEWHVRPYAIWLAMFTGLVWIWSWCVVRGILRVTAAGIVGAWFFQQ
jgi:Plasma-membrane choline transporter